MPNNERSDEGPDLQPGQIWLIEQPTAGSLSTRNIGALAGADVVLYDRRLASIIADLLPSGSYAEPLPAGVEEDAPAISARALKLACEGWSVVQLVQPCRSWRRRLRAAAEELRWSSGTGNPAVRLFANTTQPPRGREVRPQELRDLVDGSAEREPLTLIVGPLAARSLAANYACAANGLAG
jgi:hypothetical protein